MKKHLFIFLLAFLAGACGKEYETAPGDAANGEQTQNGNEPGDAGASRIGVTVNFTGIEWTVNNLAVTFASSRAAALPGENAVSAIDLYMFASGSADGPFIYEDSWRLDATSSTKIEALAARPFKTFYAIANSPRMIDGLTAGVSTVNEFLAQTTFAVTYPLTPPLPMSAAATIDLSATTTLSMTLQRLCARLDIANDPSATGFDIRSVTISDARDGVKLFTAAPSYSPAAAAPFTIGPPLNANGVTTGVTIYVAPSTATGQLTISFSGENIVDGQPDVRTINTSSLDILPGKIYSFALPVAP